MVSTPNSPGGLFQKLEQEPESTCISKRIRLDYTVGLNKIFTEAEIEKAKASPSFEREYNLRYLGLIGNSFRQADIQRAVEFEYNPDEWQEGFECSMGVDPAFGTSSKFAITVTSLVDSTIRVLYSEEFERPDHTSVVELIADLMQKYNVVHCYIDASQPSLISSPKSSIGEEPKYQGVLGVTVQAQQRNSPLDNFTGPHYGMPCKDCPSTICYYPAPSAPTQQPQRNGTTIFSLPPFARTHNNITNLPALPGGCLDDPGVACGP
jgi:hypothetical protein